MSALWSAPEFETIAELVEARAGLRFAPNRCESLERAVRQITHDTSSETLRAFSERLVARESEWERLLARLTVGETYFFRDYPQFEFLEHVILPELAERHGPAYRPRLWSAGCSTGEEPYSLAISLARHDKLDGALVLGTDLSEAALASARRAHFKRWSLRDVSPQILDQYFTIRGSVVSLPAEITSRVQFERLNLAGVSYPSPSTSTFAMDVIFCRNVLIYFSPVAIQRVARRLFESLAPGGVLFVGPSDPPLQELGFGVEHVAAGTVYRRPLTTLSPEQPARRPPSSLPPRRAVERKPAPPSEPPPPSGPELRARAEEAFRARDEVKLRELCRLHSEPWLWASILRLASAREPARVVEAECREALRAHPLSAELHYLHALVAIELEQRERALEALRRAIYLEPTLAIAHFTLGSVLANARDVSGAERAYQNAVKWLSAQAEDAPVPCAHELTARGLASAAAQALDRLRARSVAR